MSGGYRVLGLLLPIALGFAAGAALVSQHNGEECLPDFGGLPF